MPDAFTNNIERAYAIIHAECDREKECEILLRSLEPVGLPGYFFYSDTYGARFNTWKEKYSKGRHYWGHYYKELELIDSVPEVLFYAFGTSDPEYLYRWKREALRIPVPTTMAIEALVKASYWDHTRVKRAINTLIDFKDNPTAYAADYRLSCPTAKAELYIEDNPNTPDFDDVKVLPPKDTPYFFAPLVRRALLSYPGFVGSKLDQATLGKGL